MGKEYMALDCMGMNGFLDRLEDAGNARQAEAHVRKLVEEGLQRICAGGHGMTDSHFVWLDRNMPFEDFLGWCRAYAQAGIDREENNFFDWLESQGVNMDPECDNPLRFPARIEKKYGLHGTDFADFLKIEASEAGSLENVEKDIRKMLSALACDNVCITHPWFTESQRRILLVYLDGEFSGILAEPDREKAFAWLGHDGDGLVKSLMAACDSCFSRMESHDAFAMALEAVERMQNEESQKPGM